MLIRFKPDGSISMIYDENYTAVMALGKKKIRRVSNVEPNEDGDWVADMSPLGPAHEGVKLGPYALRSEAITAELNYLKEHMT